MGNVPTPQRRLLDRHGILEYQPGIGRRMADRIIYERMIPTVKVGSRVFVWSDDLDAYFAANERPARGTER